MQRDIVNWQRAAELAVAAVCGYEAAVIAMVLSGRQELNDRLVSALCRRYRWLGPVILGGLALHIYPPRKPSVIIVKIICRRRTKG